MTIQIGNLQWTFPKIQKNQGIWGEEYPNDGRTPMDTRQRPGGRRGVVGSQACLSPCLLSPALLPLRDAVLAAGHGVHAPYK